MSPFVALVFDVLRNAHGCAQRLCCRNNPVRILREIVVCGRYEQNLSRCEAGYQIRNIVTRREPWNHFRHLDSKLVIQLVLVRTSRTARTCKANALVQRAMKQHGVAAVGMPQDADAFSINPWMCAMAHSHPAARERRGLGLLPGWCS